jgi:hypothetical protein
MKILILILILISFSCKSKKIETEPIKQKLELGFDVTAKVSKIDSIANYYLVFIENNKEFFKIISDKNQAKPYNGVKVKVGENYNFKIQQITNRKPTEQNSPFTPVNYLDITRCEDFKGTEICTESSFELAKSSNLKGLYLTN